MATSQNTLIGRASGSVDGVTFLTIFRQNVMRAKMSAQTNPNSSAQQAQRFKYNTLRTLYISFQTFIDVGLQNNVKGMSLWNSFLKYNMKTVFQNNGTSVPDVFLQNLIISRGQLFISKIRPTGYVHTNRFVNFAYFSGSVHNQESSDSLSLFAINTRNNEFGYLQLPRTRANGSGTVVFPTNMQIGDPIFIFYYFISSDGKLISDSNVLFVLN